MNRRNAHLRFEKGNLFCNKLLKHKCDVPHSFPDSAPRWNRLQLEIFLLPALAAPHFPVFILVERKQYSRQCLIQIGHLTVIRPDHQPWILPSCVYRSRLQFVAHFSRRR